MSKMSRKNMNSNEAFCWDNESATTANNHWLLLYDDMRLHNGLLNNHWLLLEDNWLLHHWFLYYNYRRSLHHWLLLDYNLRSVVSMTHIEEFRTEVNSACWLTIKVDLDPLLASTILSEDGKWHLSHSNHWSLERIFVPNLNVHLLGKQIRFNLHELQLPVRVFTSIFTNSRSPFLVPNFDEDKGVHFVQKTSKISIEVRLN